MSEQPNPSPEEEETGLPRIEETDIPDESVEPIEPEETPDSETEPEPSVAPEAPPPPVEDAYVDDLKRIAELDAAERKPDQDYRDRLADAALENLRTGRPAPSRPSAGTGMPPVPDVGNDDDEMMTKGDFRRFQNETAAMARQQTEQVIVQRERAYRVERMLRDELSKYKITHPDNNRMHKIAFEELDAALGAMPNWAADPANLQREAAKVAKAIYLESGRFPGTASTAPESAPRAAGISGVAGPSQPQPADDSIDLLNSEATQARIMRMIK